MSIQLQFNVCDFYQLISSRYINMYGTRLYIISVEVIANIEQQTAFQFQVIPMCTNVPTFLAMNCIYTSQGVSIYSLLQTWQQSCTCFLGIFVAFHWCFLLGSADHISFCNLNSWLVLPRIQVLLHFFNILSNVQIPGWLFGIGLYYPIFMKRLQKKTLHGSLFNQSV